MVLYNELRVEINQLESAGKFREIVGIWLERNKIRKI